MHFGLERTQFLLGTLTSPETYHLVFLTTQISPTRSTIRISESLEWTSMSCLKDQDTVSAAADAEVQRSHTATEPMLMMPEHGLRRTMVSKSWRSENGTRPWRTDWKNDWMPQMRSPQRIDSPSWATPMQTMLPRHRSRDRI